MSETNFRRIELLQCIYNIFTHISLVFRDFITKSNACKLTSKFLTRGITKFGVFINSKMKYLVIPINLNHLMLWHPTQFGSASKTKHNNFFLPNSWLCMEMPYPRLMAWSMAVLPLWAGRWILLQMLGRSLIKYSTYSKRVI